MRKNFVLVCLLLVSPLSFLSAQVQQEWVARYHGGCCGATAIALDAKENIYVTGSGGTIKYDVEGNQVWVARTGGMTALALDAKGSVYVTGGAERSYVTIKYDTEGQEVWVARYNGPGNGFDNASAIAVDDEGNVYVTGASAGDGTGLDYATIKYDPDGDQLWVARYNGPGNRDDRATALAVDSEGNVYVTGASAGDGTGLDYATIKYDPDGDQLWVARYNGPGNAADEAKALAVDAEGNVHVTGWSIRSASTMRIDEDYATIKYDADGNQLWAARYHGPSEIGLDAATAIVLDTDGNVYVTGQSFAGGNSTDYATVKYDAEGTEVWVARYHGPVNDRNMATAIALDAEENVYVTGASCAGTGPRLGYIVCINFNYATIKYDRDGNGVWVARYGGPRDPEDPENYGDFARAIALDAEGAVYVTGSSGVGGYATIKYSQ